MTTTLAWIDYLIMVIYLGFVLGIGLALKKFMKTSEDFFLSGRSIPAWVAGLAFISTNLGAQEVMGMAASGAKYGIATSHFYWLGAIPAMVFVGLFMMPFYYGSRAHSVPEYLRLRFDEKTRGLNAITFAIMTIFSSGISMYAMALLIKNLHIFDGVFRQLHLPMEWIFDISLVASAVIVLAYVYLGGLTSAIYNEVLQFFLIVAGFLPLVLLGLKNVGGWEGLKLTLGGMGKESFTHAWRGMAPGSPHPNPLGVGVFGLTMGLGFVLSFGYWCTNFLVVQRSHGGRLDAQRPPHAPDRRGAQDVLPVPGDPAGPDRDRPADGSPRHRRQPGPERRRGGRARGAGHHPRESRGGNRGPRQRGPA